MKKTGLAIAMIGVVLSGCATMFSKTADVLEFKSDPPGATVELDGREICATPCRYLVQRETFRDHHIVVRKDGYRTFQGDLGKSLDEKSLFNFGFFLTTMGGTSWGIDALTGAMFRFDKDSYFIQLERDGSTVGSDPVHIRRRFVVENFVELKREVALGSGEALALYQQLRVRSSLKPAVLRKEQLLDAQHGLAFFDLLEGS